MAKYLVKRRFLEPSGEWHHPGDIVEWDKDKAELMQTRGWIVVYNTQSVSPPETRSFLTKRRKDHAVAQTGH